MGIPGWFTPSNVMGSAFLALGLVPGCLWILDYIDFIRPGSEPAEWPIMLMSLFLVAVGSMLLGGKGDKIGEAFMSWFGKRRQMEEGSDE